MVGLVVDTPDTNGEPLPPLREDLQLLPGPDLDDGSPSWQLHDPARSRFFRIGWREFEILSRWHYGSSQDIQTAISKHTSLHINETEIDSLLDFLAAQQLLLVEHGNGVERLIDIAQKHRPPLITQALKNYLFFRVPLWRPDPFLSDTQALVMPLFSKGFALFLLFASVLGFYLLSRQWESFANSYLFLQTWQGIALVAVAVLFSKLVHELGHAYASKRYGLRVPSMGVAFMVMWPVLYTETSDAWRLRDRNPRLLIGAAGMLAELSLAILASLAWGLSPDGPFRSAMFLLAGTTWIMTLAINLNPFMRFDGYFLLSDWLGIPNLHERSFALGRWQLRRSLFGWQEPRPEHFPPGRHRFMVVFAWAVWLYRFILFLGIALLVYYFFFKLAGIILMAVELAWFIGRPIWREMQEWHRRREHFHWNPRLIMTLSTLGLILLLVAIPRPHLMLLPATLQVSAAHTLYPSSGARLQQVLVNTADRVEAEQALIQLESPTLQKRLALALTAVATAEENVLRLNADRSGRDQLRVAEQRLAEANSRLQAVKALQQQLTLRSPAAGKVYDIQPDLHPGRWLNEGQPLLRVVSEGYQVQAFVEAADLDTLDTDAQAYFHADDPSMAAVPLTFKQLDQHASTTLPDGYLASTNNGPLAVRDEKLQPEKALYRVHYVAATALGAPRIVNGRVRLWSKPRSHLSRTWRHLLAILQRETGF